ncbi:hypothetical protein [Sulfuriroseicoccus oceanibius]|uniref:Periplasmic nitrate reductase chaperone NapD n=1 Tax=Sulfuriroseicoccus oceanibius TaxID=2707525 RepID=A0A6B3LC50_9BACT|nr:hypothetical protein [Sulfuriroseicoccus oceanibius]QQL44855.1 hypothetical protein G3M56_013410 [Sulfuriroseicoccus oceanibius]
MPISGLLLTLYDPADAADVVESLAALDHVDCGAPNQRWIPIAVDSPDSHSARQLHEELLSIKGVAAVDVVSVSFDEALAPEPPAPQRAHNPPPD